MSAASNTSAVRADFRITCYDGQELIFTNDKYVDGVMTVQDFYDYPVGQCKKCPAGEVSMLNALICCGKARVVRAILCRRCQVACM